MSENEDKNPQKKIKEPAANVAEMTPADIQRIWKECHVEIQKAIIGKVRETEDIMIVLLAEGHVLEGVRCGKNGNY